MDGIAIDSFRTRCAGCGQAVPINSCAEGVACSACHRAIALDWQALLTRALATKGESGTFAAHVGDATIAVTRRPATASCPTCQAPLPDEVKGFASRGWTMCPSCGKKLSLRLPPPQLAWANAELVVAEGLVPPTTPPAPQPVMLGCLACRAPMRADGGERIAKCTACGIDNYLPDELWARLHPPQAAIRWYVVGGSAPHAHHDQHHHAAAAPHASPAFAQAHAAPAPFAPPHAAPPSQPAPAPFAPPHAAHVAPGYAPPSQPAQFAPPTQPAQFAQAPHAGVAPGYAPPPPGQPAQFAPAQPPQFAQQPPQFAPPSQAAANAAAVQAIFGSNVVVRPGAQIVIQSAADRADRTGRPAAFASMIVHGREERDYWSEDYDGPEKWKSLENVVMGLDGLFYCGGENDWGDAVWCMGPDMMPRWCHKLKMSDIQVALDPKHQRVVCWSTSKHSAIVLSAVDGSMVGTIGGKEPDDAKIHHLDMDDCKDLVGDIDGTLLALMGERLVRYDGHGTGIATWPPRASGVFGGVKPEKLEPLYFMGQDGKRHRRDVEGVNIEEVNNYPMALDDYTNLHVGRDGRYYFERSRWVACFDRTGKRLYKKQLPLESSDDQLATDMQGNLYIYGNRGSDPLSRQVVRISADGSRADMVARDRTAGGAVGREDKLCVGPDGTIYLFDSYRRLRILGPDGGMRWQSPESLEEDADEDKQIADRS